MDLTTKLCLRRPLSPAFCPEFSPARLLLALLESNDGKCKFDVGFVELSDFITTDPIVFLKFPDENRAMPTYEEMHSTYNKYFRSAFTLLQK